MTCVKGRTNPKLWERSKREAVSRLGGRFSARAMQLAAKLYRDGNGGYCGPKTRAQASMTKWTRERWTTADGRKACRKTPDGKTVCDRYLPAKAWAKLTPAQRRATRARKLTSSTQWVPNTKAARVARRKTT